MISVVDVATVLAAIGAFASAWAAWRAAAATNRAIQMQVLLDFAKRDASEEMGKAITVLWDFRKKENDTQAEFAERFLTLKKDNPPEWLRPSLAPSSGNVGASLK